MKKYLFTILLLIFSLFSFVFLSPKFEQETISYHSSELKKATNITGNVERTDYNNENGEITVAADFGYATVVITRDDYSELEQYFDNKGNPVSRKSGYFKVAREYDSNGSLHITYLDRENKPINTIYGYAKERWDYSDDGKVMEIRYFDEGGMPTFTKLYGYGRKYKYDEEGNVCKITYIDIYGNPILTGQGFASIKREYYSADEENCGKVKNEFYYDEQDKPIALNLGQYGVHKEYNNIGQDAVISYLDANGRPITTNKGYTTIIRTFQADNTVIKEYYFDINGNPVALSEGQFGISIENGKRTYLDNSGNEKFNLRNLLYNESHHIIIIAITVVIISSLLKRGWNVVFLLFCIFIIFYFALMYRDVGETSKGIGLFSSYRDFFSNENKRADILRNIWLFIPLGAVLYRIYPQKWILLVPILLSIVIEGIQYFRILGYCEMDDVISNGLGSALGYEMGCLAQTIRKHFSRK